MSKVFYLLLLLFLSLGCSAQKLTTNITELILANEHLIAVWDFSEKEGESKYSQGKAQYRLDEHTPTRIPVIDEGPLSGKSVLLDGKSWLSLPHAETGDLNITDEVTVMAWVKWTGQQTGFVGGMWNEYQDGGKRQYGLFISLPYYNGRNQVCGHISKTGKPTPPFPYSIDYSASKQLVPAGEWVCVAFTYDGQYIKSYLNGVFEVRKEELINHTTGFEGYPDGLVQSKNPYYFSDGMGDNGSDFTVGAVLLAAGMGNFYKGQIGGLAVFDKALSDCELLLYAELGKIR